MNDENIANICKALGEYNRLKIVMILSQGELCACKILECFNFSQPTLSHHMKVLCDCNLVHARKDGKWSHYRLNTSMVNFLQDFFININKVSDEVKMQGDGFKLTNSFFI